MNARELHDKLEYEHKAGLRWLFSSDAQERETVLRALRLLAAAEGGEGTPETDAFGIQPVSDLLISHVMRTQAHTELESLLQEWGKFARRLERERNGLAARVAELEAALDRYGCHADSCGDMDAMNGAEIKSCNCGLDAARSK